MAENVEDEDFDVPLDWPRDELNPLLHNAAGDADDAGAGDDEIVDDFDHPHPRGRSVPPLLPAIAGRLDSVYGAVSALSPRIDTLNARFMAFQTAIADQFTDHLELTTSTARSQSETLDGYRRANDRSIAELRRVTTDSGETLHRIATELDEVAGDTQSLVEQWQNRANEALATDAPGAAREMAESFAVMSSDLVARLDSLEANLIAIANAANTRRPEGADGFAPEAFSEIGNAVIDQLHRIEALVSSARTPVEAELADELMLLREEVKQLKRRIGLRARAPMTLDEDQIRSLAELLEPLLPQPSISDDAFERLAETIVFRLSAMFEVVADEPQPAPPVEPSPAKKARSTARSKLPR